MIKKNRYRHVFFDLDRTLWDFDKNTRDALIIIYEKYNLSTIITDIDAFINAFRKNNEQMWISYRRGEITKSKLREIRFYKTLKEFNIEDNGLAKKMDADYILLSPDNTQLIPHTTEVLEYLQKRYTLYILTNGFRETQTRKIFNSGIESYFTRIFTSDDLHSTKPNKQIFHLALSAVNAKKSESIMVGDDLLIDIIGAREYGIDQVHLNPDKKVHNQKITYEICSLKELMDIL